MDKFSKFVKYKLYEAETATPVGAEGAGTTTPKELKCLGVLKTKATDIKKKVTDKKGGKTTEGEKKEEGTGTTPTTGGIELNRDVDIVISSKAANYTLEFLDLNEEDNPIYNIIDTNDNKVKEQIKTGYVFLNDDIFNGLQTIYDGLAKWRSKLQQTTATTQPNNQQPVQPQPAMANASNITSYSEFLRLYETETQNEQPVKQNQQQQQQQVSAITPEKFDTYVISQFTNPKVFQNFENWAEISAAIGKLKGTALYGISYKDFLQKRNYIVPDSKKINYVTRWYIGKWDDKKHKYPVVDVGDSINTGDGITFKKIVKEGETAFDSKGFIITKVQVKQKQQPTK